MIVATDNLRLHVTPDGGVRTCMYASGAGWLGNIRRQRLLEIAADFAGNPVTRLFARDPLPVAADDDMPPGSVLVRQFRHPCAAAAVLARLAEKTLCGSGTVPVLQATREGLQEYGPGCGSRGRLRRLPPGDGAAAASAQAESGGKTPSSGGREPGG